MNRKNLTAAVLAGLAGVAGIAGTAQAVNLNPDGIGQVLIYPYYTSNGGNQTILSVVNTTDAAKAVKVRFLEGFNSREVLDFNLYMSPNDVWAAAVADDSGTPTLYIPDDSCTAPYLYEMGSGGPGVQEFLSLAYNDVKDSKGNVVFENDGGPTGIERAAEGHFEMIEMGTIVEEDCTDDDDPVLGPVEETFCDITHRMHFEYDEKDKLIKGTGEWFPGNCEQLSDNWTSGVGVSDGIWITDPDHDISRNSGGLFGGAAIVNSENGTMYSYNAHAIQGFDKSDGDLHKVPGTSLPSLNSGDQDTAWVFFGVPTNEAKELDYGSPHVDAVSAVFMHENIMNEYALDEALAASTEWVVTFPTKSFYVDDTIFAFISDENWVPDGDDPECNSWVPGEEFPFGDSPLYVEGPSTEPDPNPIQTADWVGCTYINVGEVLVPGEAREPFTELFDGKACELASLQVWDRNERTPSIDPRSGVIPPVVSPSIPGACDPSIQFCEDATPFELCYEVNVLRFGDGVIFDTPEIEGSSLLLEVAVPYENGWGRIDLGFDPHHQDEESLVGLPAIGFAAYEFENAFVTGGDGVQDVKAFYGGLFGHRANVRRSSCHEHDEVDDAGRDHACGDR